MPRTAVTAAGDGRLTAHHVEVLARTVQRQQHRLSSDPTFMSGHLHNALRIDGDDDVHDALCARAISSLANRTWLQLLHRPPVPRSAFLRAFDVGSEVVAVCWLAGDDQLVTAGGRSITIWDAESGREITRLDMPEGVSTAAAAPSRDLLAWGETGGAVRLWDACAGVERQLDGAHTDRVEAVAFSPSGAWLASTAQDRNVRIWNLERGGCRAIECAVVADRLVFFPDERCLAFDLAGSVHLHPLDSGPDTEVVLTQSVAQNTAVGMVSKLGPPKRSAIAVASDGRRFAGGGFAGARVWDLAGEPEPWIATVADGVLTVAFSPDGTSLATGADRTPFVELWDIVARDSPSELEGHQRDVFALAFSPDGRALASAGWDPYAILWDVDTGARRAVLAGHTSRIETLVFSPSSRVLATGSADGTARLWDAHVPLVDDDPADLDVRHPARAETAAYASNARVAATGVGLDVLIWSGDIGAKWNGASSDDAYVRKLGLSADGRVLGVGELIHTREGTTHAARVWDLVEDRSITELVIDGRATAVALSPPGDTVSVAVEAVVLVEGLTRDPHTRSLTHDAPVTALCFSPDGHWLATGGQSEPIRIWDLERGSYLHCNDETGRIPR